jgi:glycosyltransferase involved in cell wall biosynthesis
MRFLQYLPALTHSDIQVEVQALFDDGALAERYRLGRYGTGVALHCFARRLAALHTRQQFNVLWIEKEALPWWPLWAENALLRGVPYVLDYDDAVFHNYDQHRLTAVRHLFGRRLDDLMRKAKLVVCGNDYLAQRARDAGAPWVEVLPTVIDLAHYPLPLPAKAMGETHMPKVVWIGSPSTVHYLNLLHLPLRKLAERTSFVLRVVGGEITLPGVMVECLPWSEDSEVAEISDADVGIMPLLDSSWERGKCGYKLIQYMACGLPVVASPIGVNTSIVRQGVNGYLADDLNAWEMYLERLLGDLALRARMGTAGRQFVEKHYCLQVTAPQLAELLLKAVRR